MIHRYRKFITSVTLFCFIAFMPISAHAAVPFVPIAAAALTGATLITMAGALKYYKPTVADDNRAYVDKFGFICRIASATGKIMNQYAVEQYYQQKQVLSMQFEAVKNFVTGHKTSFPNLYAAFYAPPTGGEMHPVSVGERVQVNGKQYIVDSIAYDYMGGTCDAAPGLHPFDGAAITATTFQYGGAYQTCQTGISGYGDYQRGSWHEVEPIELPRSDNEASSWLRGGVSNLPPPIVIEPMRNEYLDEFDHLLDSNQSSMSITSAEDLDKNKATLVPPVWPTTINDPKAINPVQDKAAQAVDGLKTYEQAMADRLTSAIQVRDAYWSGNPGATTATDPKLAQLQNDVAAAAAAQTLAAAQVKQAEVTQAQADAEAVTAAPAVPETGTYDTLLDLPVVKPIATLLTAFVSSSPLTAMLRSFNLTTSSTVCSVSCGTIYGKELSFSFCRYTEDFAKLGGFLLVVTHGFAVLVVIRGWREN